MNTQEFLLAFRGEVNQDTIPILEEKLLTLDEFKNVKKINLFRLINLRLTEIKNKNLTSFCIDGDLDYNGIPKEGKIQMPIVTYLKNIELKEEILISSLFLKKEGEYQNEVLIRISEDSFTNK